MSTEVDRAVQDAMHQRDVEEAQAKESAATEVTTGTYVWAIVAAVISPLIGAGYGVYQLAKGRTNKGWIYIGSAAIVFVISFLLLSI